MPQDDKLQAVPLPLYDTKARWNCATEHRHQSCSYEGKLYPSLLPVPLSAAQRNGISLGNLLKAAQHEERMRRRAVGRETSVALEQQPRLTFLDRYHSTQRTLRLDHLLSSFVFPLPKVLLSLY